MAITANGLETVHLVKEILQVLLCLRTLLRTLYHTKICGLNYIPNHKKHPFLRIQNRNETSDIFRLTTIVSKKNNIVKYIINLFITGIF